MVLVVSLTIGSSQVVYATSAQNKKSEAEKNLNDVNKKIDNLENKKEEIEGRVRHKERRTCQPHGRCRNLRKRDRSE